jgi:streptogramin lyase
VAVGAVVALLVGIALVSGFLTPPGGSDPGASPAATTQVVVHSDAASVAFDATGGWLADDHAAVVRHFDPSSGRLEGAAIPAGERPIAVATGYGRVWVADTSGSQVFVIDPARNKVVGSPVAVPQGPVSIAAGNDGVWVASLLAGTVTLLDPHTREVKASTALPDGAVRLALAPGAVWVSGQTDTLTRVDPRPAGVSLRWRTVRVGRGPIGVATGAGGEWVANVQSGTVSRLDRTTVRVTATFPAGTTAAGTPSNPEIVAVWQGKVWVADGRQGAVVALDPSTGHQSGGAVALSGVIRQLVVDADGTLWGTTANPGSVVRFTT